MISFCFPSLSKAFNSETEISKYLEEINKNSEKIESATFKGNSYNIEACKTIAQSLDKCVNLKKLDFSDGFTGKLITEVPDSLKVIFSSISRRKFMN